uniref:DNA polymerase n=1 Tax=Silene vulgaris TaxID=42043 RepID=M9NCP6_SILVU|nr:DNA polymerase [Silene vulgaris]
MSSNVVGIGRKPRLAACYRAAGSLSLSDMLDRSRDKCRGCFRLDLDMKYPPYALRFSRSFSISAGGPGLKPHIFSFYAMQQWVRELESTVENRRVDLVHEFCLSPRLNFNRGVFVNEEELLTLAVMDLLVQDVYPVLQSYAKVNVFFGLLPKPNEAYKLPKKSNRITIHLSDEASPLTTDEPDGKYQCFPKFLIKKHIFVLIRRLLERYEGYIVCDITVRAYFERAFKTDSPPITYSCRIDTLLECYYHAEPGFIDLDLKNVKAKCLRRMSLERSRKKYADADRLTVIKPKKDPKKKPFLVADIETVMVDGLHVPYAIGVLKVYPDPEFKIEKIDSFFSEDIYCTNFEDRSKLMLISFINRVITICSRNRKNKLSVVYFHNLSGFDGIILLKHLIERHHPQYQVKSIMRNNQMYELAVYSGKTCQFRLRDSLHLLPGSLRSLAKNLCPELGEKGTLDPSKITLETIAGMKEELMTYMNQDIILLGGILHKFQKIHFDKFKVDIVDKRTLPALAIDIYRSNYFDQEKSHLHIPNDNEELFIRRGYYGGHTDSYIPRGENLYYYDVNSLYPYIMKTCTVPGEAPVWCSDLSQHKLEDLYGFIEAHIECPKDIKRPFLPYKDPETDTLIFPTGRWVGVYYSEELKLAKKLNYKIRPFQGYLFKEVESPFKSFVTDLYESRAKAKAEGNDSLSFIYKLLMNSLYGRLGINPEYNKTEICDYERYRTILKTFFAEACYFKDRKVIVVNYKYKPSIENKGSPYKSHKLGAVQVAAAITANARIHMYKYINRDDCYYTDTDSVVLGSPLSDDEVSPTELGKMKLEDRMKEGIFLAPKCYWYSRYSSDEEVIKYKGEGKELVDRAYFFDQYNDPSRVLERPKTKSFIKDRVKLEIREAVRTFKLQLIDNHKRVRVLDKKNQWVGSDPIILSKDHEMTKHQSLLLIVHLNAEKEDFDRKKLMISWAKNDIERIERLFHQSQQSQDDQDYQYQDPIPQDDQDLLTKDKTILIGKEFGSDIDKSDDDDP